LHVFIDMLNLSIKLCSSVLHTSSLLDFSDWKFSRILSPGHFFYHIKVPQVKSKLSCREREIWCILCFRPL